MPNIKTPRKTIAGKQQRTAQKDKALSLLAIGTSISKISSQLSCSRNTLYKYLNDPDFMALLDKERTLISIDATTQTAGLINDAIATVQKAINNGDGKLAMDFLKETGVLRTTGHTIGMEQKAGDSGQGIQVIINVSSDQFSDNNKVIDV